MPTYEIDSIIPAIDSSVFVAHNATVIGNVNISENASVWFNTVIRGDADSISIGSKTNIQDLSMLHADPGKPIEIGDMVTVGHRCVIHGCKIEDNCLIGMGAVVMNGAQIGRGSIIGAGAVVMEEMIIPPFSLVAGVPGKVKKTFDEEIIDINNISAIVYAERAKGYLNSKNFRKCD